jgi:hypothetical protein
MVLRFRCHSNSGRFPRPVVYFRGPQRNPEYVLVVPVLIPQRQNVGFHLLFGHRTVLLYYISESLVDVFGHGAVPANVKVSFFQDQYSVNLGCFG